MFNTGNDGMAGFYFLCMSLTDGKDCKRAKLKNGKCIYFEKTINMDRCNNHYYNDEVEQNTARLVRRAR